MSVTSRLVGGRTWPPASLAWGRLLAAARWPGALLVVLGLVVAMVCWPWLRRDVYWNDIADAPNHLVRLFAVEAAFSRGEQYPRWLSDLYLGYGYPLLNFYAPGTYYLGAGLHRLGMTFYASFQWLGVLAVALGAAGVYVLARSLAGGARHGAGGAPARAAALLAALVFVLSPYPFLTNLYVRAAVPEAMALALLPWLLWAGWRAWWRRGAPVALLAALVAALVLTHNISAMVGVGLLGLWLCLLAAAVAIGRRWSPGGVPDPQPEGDWGPATRRTAGAVLLGLGLSAFFWLPALAESRHVQLNLAQGGLYDPLSWLFDPCCATGRVARADYPHTPRGPADLQLVFDYNALG
ncbi:MAG TPA: 6-pyruvoyl-tetrahydropterin synthase-related protein, partial [Actinomycetes bacterium]|nr:6-pyruvoyl-tetrahydropterin synthase-related protein [Actinomycetes bacterium]